MNQNTKMWTNLPLDQRTKYKKLIINFASLTEAFTQKSFGDKHVKPFVNSKFQETAFQYAFNAVEEDISNTSFDASILTENGDKYLIGLKSFIFTSGDQKIAQFKSDSVDWADKFAKINENAKSDDVKNAKGKPLQSKINKKNNPIYLDLAKKISAMRNDRIKSSRAQLRGFKDEGKVVSVYHVLMPTESEDKNPWIYVGETSYSEINIDKIKVLGCTTVKNPSNFRFTDGRHTYKYAAADSQLFMSFDNKNIVVEKWPIKYISDAMNFFENLDSNKMIEPSDDQMTSYNISIDSNGTKLDHLQSFSWMLVDKSGQVNTRSGINAFNAQSKYKKTDRKKHIIKFENKYFDKLSSEDRKQLDSKLNMILLPKNQGKETIIKTNKLKMELRAFADNHSYLKNDLINLIYSRPHNEVYIPIPESKTFHNKYPDFFGEGIGNDLLDKDGKIIKDQKDRSFILRFLPSKNRIEGYIDQENGKAIQSPNSQSKLGKWLREEVFQLKDLELLTSEKLDILGINAIRLVKNVEEDTIDVYFIWIDPANPPKDAIGWVSKNIK